MNNNYWLTDPIAPILQASGVTNHFEISGLIQQITENLLYDLWVQWVSDENVSWKSKSKESFIIWLKEK